MADDDLYRDGELGARIELLSVPPEREEFWAQLRTAMDRPGREAQPEQPRRPKRSRRELAMVGCLAAAGLSSAASSPGTSNRPADHSRAARWSWSGITTATRGTEAT